MLNLHTVIISQLQNMTLNAIAILSLVLAMFTLMAV